MMTLAIHDQRLARPGPQNTAALRDYDSVRRAIAFISENWRTQPTIEAMADAAAVTPDELHHLFRRWAGLTPKAFMQALTLHHAKSLLRDSASVLDAALDSVLKGQKPKTAETVAIGCMIRYERERRKKSDMVEGSPKKAPTPAPKETPKTAGSNKIAPVNAEASSR